MSLDIFNIENELEPQQGHVLISEPLTEDDYFGQSVVLITEHSEVEGTVGFVLNKDSEYTLSDIIPTINADNKVYKGGPVEPNTLHYIHQYSEISNAIKIGENLFWGGDFEQIKEWMSLGLIQNDKILFFLGYSGWRKGQLQQELKNHYWIVARTTNDEIFHSQSENFWRKKVENLGKVFNKWLNVPENPNLN